MARFRDSRPTGRPAVQPSSRPAVQDEESYPSRVDRDKITLRLPRVLVKQLKVYCVVNNANLQQIFEDLGWGFLEQIGQLEEPDGSLDVQPSSRPAVHMCSSSVCVEKDSSEKSFKTHTTTTTTGRPAVQPSSRRAQPTLPGLGGELVELAGRTRFDLNLRRRYAIANKLGQGWIVVSADGRFDELIQEWLDKESQPDPKKCPDCGGDGYVKKIYFEQDGKYIKCTHPNLKGGSNG